MKHAWYGKGLGKTCCFGTVPDSTKVISALHLLKFIAPESQTLTPTLGDVANPGQGLVPTFLDDLHVADLESKNRSGQELGM